MPGIETFDDLEHHAKSGFTGSERFRIDILCRNDKGRIAAGLVASMPTLMRSGGMHVAYGFCGYAPQGGDDRHGDWTDVEGPADLPRLRFSRRAFEAALRGLSAEVAGYAYRGGVDLAIRQLGEGGDHLPYMLRPTEFIEREYGDDPSRFFVELARYVDTAPHALPYRIFREAIAFQRRKGSFWFVQREIDRALFETIIGEAHLD